MQRRTALMAKLAAGAQKRSHGLMMLIAEVKEIATARYGYNLVAKDLRDFHFTMNEDIYTRLRKRFENELSLWDATLHHGSG